MSFKEKVIQLRAKRNLDALYLRFSEADVAETPMSIIDGVKKIHIYTIQQDTAKRLLMQFASAEWIRPHEIPNVRTLAKQRIESLLSEAAATDDDWDVITTF